MLKFEVVKIVDGLMYEVKNNGKNSVKFEEYYNDALATDYLKKTTFAKAGSF